MNKKRITLIIISSFILSILPLGLMTFTVAENATVLPEYEPVDWQSGLAGDVVMPEIDPAAAFEPYMGDGGLGLSTPPVGTIVYDWYVGAISGNPDMQLRAIGDFVEVWVQMDLSFPEGDPRNDDPWRWQITDEMAQYLADEFDNTIYARDAGYFGDPADRDGTGTIFESLGWPSYTYDWVETTDPYNPQRVILKIINYRDNNYYDPTYPSYVAGFFSSTYTDYYNRNMVHLDCWAWWQRLGPEGTSWLPEHPEMVVTRPNLYESTLAHEFQHLIHRDYVVAPDTWMNEACSLFAEPLCGYALDLGQVEWFLGTPDNSLTVWGDQGDINILADYGSSFLWALYITDHYGIDFMGRYVQQGITGVEGINLLLPEGVDFLDVFHDWRLANLIKAKCGPYSYRLDELRELYNPTAVINWDELEPLNVHEIEGKKTPWIRASEEFGETYTIGTSSVPEGYPTGQFLVGPYGSEYIHFPDLRGNEIIWFDGDDISVQGWTYDDSVGAWYSGAENLYNALMITDPYTVQEGDVLTINTYWDIEDYWDFGFVQVSTDNGETWTSLANEYTTTDYESGAHPDIIANLPGLTSWSGFYFSGFGDISFDLSPYLGMEVIFGFRYMTDWNTLYEGWYISSANVGETPLTLIPVYPEADFLVSLVFVYEVKRCKFYWTFDMWKWDESEFGAAFAHVNKWTDVYLVVSSTTEAGWVDYQFKVSRLWGPMRFFGHCC